MDMSWVGMNLQLQQFDESFIGHCKKAGLNAEQTKRELLDNPVRQKIVETMCEVESLKVVRTLIVKESCCQI